MDLPGYMVQGSKLLVLQPRTTAELSLSLGPIGQINQGNILEHEICFLQNARRPTKHCASFSLMAKAIQFHGP